MAAERRAQEELLYAWMQMSVCIRGNRILSNLSFNEIMLCGLLYRQQEAGAPPLTATELGEQMRLLKSQINHILTTMGKNGLIERTRGTEDRRVIHVHLLEKGRLLYEQEHSRVLDIVQLVQDELGTENAQQLTALIAKATAVVNSYSER